IRAGFAPGYNQYSTKRADVSTGAERPMFPCCIVPQVLGNPSKLSGIADERRACRLHSGCPTMTVLCQEVDMGHRVSWVLSSVVTVGLFATVASAEDGTAAVHKSMWDLFKSTGLVGVLLVLTSVVGTALLIQYLVNM